MKNGVIREDRVFMTLDGSNFFFFIQKKLGWQIDPGKLREFVGQWGTIIDAYYYLSVLPDEKDERQEGYRKALYFMGYSIKPVIVKQINTAEGIKEKANADIRIALDAYMAADLYDTLVLVSGDGDFAYLLELLKTKGKKIKVISGAHMVARELIELAGQNFIDFKDIREMIEKEP